MLPYTVKVLSRGGNDYCISNGGEVNVTWEDPQRVFHFLTWVISRGRPHKHNFLKYKINFIHFIFKNFSGAQQFL